MDTPTRVGVVEIGSRAVRLLVAEISTCKELKKLATPHKETQLLSAVMANTDSIAREIKKINKNIQWFLKICHAKNVNRIRIVGTAAIRDLQQKSKPLFQELCKLIPNMEVLSEKKEAWYSLVTAVKDLPSEFPCASNVITIDQGAGSTEIAVGSLLDSLPKLESCRSYRRLGTYRIFEILKKENNRTSNLKETIYKWFDKRLLKLPGKDIHATTVLLGSAATKFAHIYMQHYENSDSIYSRDSIHGKVFNREQLDKFVDMSMQNPGTIRSLISPGKPNSGEYGEIISGFVALSVILRELQKDRFIVDGHGPRYGLAWEIATKSDYSQDNLARIFHKKGLPSCKSLIEWDV